MVVQTSPRKDLSKDRQWLLMLPVKRHSPREHTRNTLPQPALWLLPGRPKLTQYQRIPLRHLRADRGSLVIVGGARWDVRVYTPSFLRIVYLCGRSVKKNGGIADNQDALSATPAAANRSSSPAPISTTRRS